MWDLPGPGLEPVSPALAGGLPTTAPPGKPWTLVNNNVLIEILKYKDFMLKIPHVGVGIPIHPEVQI